MKHNSYILSEFQRDNLRGLFQLKILAVITIMLILTVGALCIIHVNQVCKQQIDTLDTLQSLRLEVWHGQNQKQDSVDPISSISLSPDERELVERVVAAEARGESIQGMQAVAQTIRDRSQLWGMSVTAVLTEPGQYAEPYQGEISSDVKNAVNAVFDDGEMIFDSPVTHFASNDPYWAEGKTCRGSIGRHTFWY